MKTIRLCVFALLGFLSNAYTGDPVYVTYSDANKGTITYQPFFEDDSGLLRSYDALNFTDSTQP